MEYETCFSYPGKARFRAFYPASVLRHSPQLSGKVLRLPAREEIDANLNEQLIVEFYSR